MSIHLDTPHTQNGSATRRGGGLVVPHRRGQASMRVVQICQIDLIDTPHRSTRHIDRHTRTCGICHLAWMCGRAHGMPGNGHASTSAIQVAGHHSSALRNAACAASRSLQSLLMVDSSKWPPPTDVRAVETIKWAGGDSAAARASSATCTEHARDVKRCFRNASVCGGGSVPHTRPGSAQTRLGQQCRDRWTPPHPHLHGLRAPERLDHRRGDAVLVRLRRGDATVHRPTPTTQK